jgi:hypothetical protein
VASVDPTPKDVQRLLAEDAGGPVNTLNPLKFKPGRRADYEARARSIVPHLRATDSEVPTRVTARRCSRTG